MKYILTLAYEGLLARERKNNAEKNEILGLFRLEEKKEEEAKNKAQADKEKDKKEEKEPESK